MTGGSPALTLGGGSVGLAVDDAGGYGNGSSSGTQAGRTAKGWFRGGQEGPARSLGGGSLAEHARWS